MFGKQWEVQEVVGFISLGKAMIQREAAFLDSSKLKSTRGNGAAAASQGWFVLTLLDLLPDAGVGPLARPGNSPAPMTEVDPYICLPSSTSAAGETYAERQPRR